jgi:hypothetical protein
MNYGKFLLMGLGLCFTIVVSQAQSLSPQVVSSAGGKMQSSTIRLDWTLGETAVARWNTPNGFTTEGFHQPVLEVSLLPEYSTPKVSIAPNPVQSILNVQLKEASQKALFVQLVDVQGRVIVQRTSLGLGNTELNMSDLPSGIFFLQVLQQNGKTLEAFKVIKTN